MGRESEYGDMCAEGDNSESETEFVNIDEMFLNIQRNGNAYEVDMRPLMFMT